MSEAHHTQPPPPEKSHGSSSYDVHDDNLRPPSRRALLHIPETYRRGSPSPLIVALHGKAQPPSEFEYHTQFSNADFNAHAIVAYPEGIKLQWTGDPEAPPRKEVDDIHFINVLIDHLERDYTVDPKAIYVAGFSNGGGLAGLLACDARASGRIAAFAISSGAVYQDSALKEPLFSHCSPSRSPIPILEFHGDSDPVIHYDGKTTPDGETYPIDEWLRDWAVRNGCRKEDDGTHTLLYDGKLIKTVWDGDDVSDSDVVEHYKIEGFGHGWPTTFPLNNDEQRHGPTFFNATPLVLEFFPKHKLRSKK